MTFRVPALVVLAAAVAAPALALTKEDAIRIATEKGVCDPLVVTDASLVEGGKIKATCGEATGFVPLLGGLAPALGIGAAGVAAVAAAGGSSGTTTTSTR